MSPQDAARSVVDELGAELSITDDHIERVVLHKVREAFTRFAELMDGAE